MTDKFTVYDEVVYVTDPVTQTRHSALVKSLPSASTDIHRWELYTFIPGYSLAKRVVEAKFLNKILAGVNRVGSEPGPGYWAANPISEGVPYNPYVNVYWPVWVSDQFGVNWTGSYRVQHLPDEEYLSRYGTSGPWSLIKCLATSEQLGIVVGQAELPNYSEQILPNLFASYCGAVYSYDGYNWYSGSMTNPAGCNTVAYSPTLQRFVGLGQRTRGWYSDNGVHWKDTPDISGPLIKVNSVIWDSVNEKFIAVGKSNPESGNSSGSILSSTDGINWTVQIPQLSPYTEEITRVGVGNGVIVTVGGPGGFLSNNNIITSIDGGTTWNVVAIVSASTRTSPNYPQTGAEHPAYSPTLNKFYIPYERNNFDYNQEETAALPYDQSVPYLYFLTSSDGVTWGNFKTPISLGLSELGSLGSSVTAKYSPRNPVVEMFWSTDFNGFFGISKDGTWRSDVQGLRFTSSFESDIAGLEFVSGTLPANSIYSSQVLTYTSSLINEYPFYDYTTERYEDRNVTQWIEFDLNRDGGDPYGPSGLYRSTASLGIILDSASLQKFTLVNSSGVDDVTISGIRYLRENGMSYEDNYISGLYGPTARIPNGKFIPVSNTSFRFTTTAGNGSVTSIPNQLLGTASLTLSETPTVGDNTYGYWEINLPFPIDYNGTTYNTIYVGTCSHITFESGYEYAIDSATATYQNKLPVSGYYNYCYRIYYGQEGNTFRIRWEGNSEYDESGTSKIWEMVFYQNISNQIDLHMGTNPNVVEADTYQMAYYEHPNVLTITTASTSTFTASLKADGRDYVSMWFGVYGDSVDDEVGLILNLNNGEIVYQEDALGVSPNAAWGESFYGPGKVRYNMTYPSYDLIFIDRPKLVNKTNGYWELSFKVGYNSGYADEFLYRSQSVNITPTSSIPSTVFSRPAVPPKNITPPIDPFSLVTTPTPEYWWRADSGLTTSSWIASTGGIDFQFSKVTTASIATGVFFSSSLQTQSFGSSSVLSQDIQVKHLFIRADDVKGRGAIFGGTANDFQQLLFFLTTPNVWVATEYTKSNAATSTYQISSLRTGSKLTHINFDENVYFQTVTATSRVDNKVPYSVSEPYIASPSTGTYTKGYIFPSGSKILLGRRQFNNLNSYAQLYIKEIAIFTSSISIGEAYKFSKEMMERWP